jgi:hypothetical protein
MAARMVQQLGQMAVSPDARCVAARLGGRRWLYNPRQAGVAELVDATDLKRTRA